ncbi:MAG: hypothetical protein ACRC3Z_12245 [Phocaeicola sp.]
MWSLATSQKESTFALQAFRAYRQVAESEEAIHHLYQMWETKELPTSFQLSESDYITLSYKLAMHLSENSNQIVATQLGRITNPDRQKEYRFIAPSVSPQKEVRDSLFQALLKAENRRIEPWAATALSHLNSSVWKEGSTHYIRPGLEVVREVQRTGDIFFPTAWARALLAGHHSIEAREEVERFFADHPSYPTMLATKIKQQADHLYRLKRAE